MISCVTCFFNYQRERKNLEFVTGAKYCSISADLVTIIDPTFLVLGVYEQY